VTYRLEQFCKGRTDTKWDLTLLTTAAPTEPSNAREPAAAVAADHNQLRPFRRLNQRTRRLTKFDFATDPHIGIARPDGLPVVAV
jgi:hypothetical protein